MVIIAPSILAFDASKFGVECRKICDAGAEWIHWDLMDGEFVPNLTFGPPVVNHVRKALADRPSLFFDCHLMVKSPANLVEDLQKAGATSVTVHLESFVDTNATYNVEALKACLTKIRAHDMKVGIAINPATSVDELLEIMASSLVGLVDMVLIMTVVPGFCGQSFHEECVEKIVKVRQAHPQVLIQVDGGIGLSNVAKVCQAGADAVVVGSAAAKAPDLTQFIADLREYSNQQ